MVVADRPLREVEDREHQLQRVRRRARAAAYLLVVDAATKSARVVVPDFQLSLAIGKEGQNARLAARLTGWRIDIRSDEPGNDE